VQHDSPMLATTSTALQFVQTFQRQNHGVKRAQTHDADPLASIADRLLYNSHPSNLA
jgi:hypothetical protein